jgi:hypothetical protein
MMRPFLDLKFTVRSLAALAAVAIVAAPASAQPDLPPKPKSSLRKEGEQLFGPAKAKSADASGTSFWSVVIQAFRGDDQEQAAHDGLQKLRTETPLSDAYLEKRGNATVIAFGKYADASSKEAKEGLEKVRNTEVIISNVKTKPFDKAFLAPPADIPGSIPEWDLRQARKTNGDWALYTLQMGVYTRTDKQPTPAELAEFRKAAETAVGNLRREGEQAFYYHGPKGSEVTIGLFGKDDFDPQTPGVESADLTALRKRFPYNLYNGQAIKESVRVTTQSGKQAQKQQMQSSRLVAVPKSE